MRCRESARPAIREKMPLEAHKPIVYLITSGRTTAQTNAASEEFSAVLKQVAAAIAANVPLFQIREKNLTARVLYELTTEAAKLVRGGQTRLLVNDRADVARAAGADGVHLTTRSLEAAKVRQAFGADFLIGVSTHSADEVREARDGGADFAVFGPVFETPSKSMYGQPLSIAKLEQAARELAPFPLLALGGVTLENASTCLQAGAAGIAAIRLLGDPESLGEVVEKIRAGAEEEHDH